MDIETSRQLLWRLLRVVVGRGNKWRTLALLFLACNHKNLPFVWHYRFFQGLFIHSLRPRQIPRPSTSEAYPLFLPVITSTHSPILECDFNIHKSNSTYFSDLDVSRTHLISLLCSPGLAGYHKRRALGQEDRLGIALGGVACFFLKEIKPYEKYEMWTRVLCWDQKWVYMVTHFVKKGAVRPTAFVMQPGEQSGWWASLGRTKPRKSSNSAESAEELNSTGKNVIFSTAISKYVFKSGRKTIAPELVLERCGQLPPKPADSGPSPSPSVENSGLAEHSAVDAIPDGSIEDIVDSSLTPLQENATEWTWEMIEKERLRGMKIGELMAGMDKLKEEFTGDSKPALGAYRDLLWA